MGLAQASFEHCPSLNHKVFLEGFLSTGRKVIVMSATPEDGLSYEEACAAAAEEQLRTFPPLDGAKNCPLRGTIFRLAEAESLGNALDEELQGVKKHTGVCSACQHTYGRASSFYVARATSEECSGPEVVGGVDFESGLPPFSLSR